MPKTLPRRTFLSTLAALPLGGLVARGLVACDGASGAAAARDTSLPADGVDDTSTPEVITDTSATPDTEAPADTAVDTTPRTCTPTRSDAQGPFFEPDAPAVVALASDTEPGTEIAISGVVRDAACRPIAGATVEVWQADDAGDYFDDKLRATLTTDDSGRYAFSSIRPGAYLQSTGFRPAHLHYKVSADGYRQVTTQVYFEGDPYLAPNDSCGSCGSGDEDRIIPLVADTAGVEVGVWDAVLVTS